MCGGIRQLQLILLKVALLLGVEIYTGVEFEGLKDPQVNDMGVTTGVPQLLWISYRLSIYSY